MAETINILSDEFAEAAVAAGLRARLDALSAGKVVVYRDDLDRYIEELPDGRRFEVRLQPETSRDSHIRIVRELPTVDG